MLIIFFLSPKPIFIFSPSLKSAAKTRLPSLFLFITALATS